MISKLFDIILNFITKTIGTTLTVVIVVFALGIYVAVSYPLGNYVVTPETLQKTKDSLNTRMDKFSAKNGINIAEMELASLRKEKFDLEDLVDCDKPKRKYIERLKEVNERIKELEADKKDFLKTLEIK